MELRQQEQPGSYTEGPRKSGYAQRGEKGIHGSLDENCGYDSEQGPDCGFPAGLVIDGCQTDGCQNGAESI